MKSVTEIRETLTGALTGYCNVRLAAGKCDENCCYCCPIRHQYDRLYDGIAYADTEEYQKDLKDFLANVK